MIKVLRGTNKNTAENFLSLIRQCSTSGSAAVSRLQCVTKQSRASSGYAADHNFNDARLESNGEGHKRLNDSNPLHHHDDHCGMLFPVTPEDQMFYKDSVRKHYLKLCRALNEMAVMIRSPATEIFNYLDAANYNLPPVRYGIYGESGCGKSTTLCHVLHRCASDGWLVLHHPYVARMLRFYGYNSILEKSIRNAGLFDQPKDAQSWLKYFHRINKKFLDTVEFNTSEEYTFSKKEMFPADTPIVDLLEFSEDREQFSTDIVGILLKEIKQQTHNKSFRTLVALDGFNTLFEEFSTYKSREDHLSCYPTERFSLARSFKKLLRHDWTNAAVVCVIDGGACNPPQKPYKPIQVLGKQGFHQINPFIPIEVPRYSEQEATCILKYLADKKFLQHPFAHTEEGRKQFMFFSELNPLQLYNCTLRW